MARVLEPLVGNVAVTVYEDDALVRISEAAALVASSDHGTSVVRNVSADELFDALRTLRRKTTLVVMHPREEARIVTEPRLLAILIASLVAATPEADSVGLLATRQETVLVLDLKRLSQQPDRGNPLTAFAGSESILRLSVPLVGSGVS